MKQILGISKKRKDTKPIKQELKVKSWRKMMENELTQKQVRELLDYDPLTGDLRWSKTIKRMKKGALAGTKDKSGYIHMGLNNSNLMAHRVIWLGMTGEMPKEFIDHVNGIKDDNRWSNLREATRFQNSYNRPKNKNNKSGIKGVSIHKATGKWQAQISHNRKKVYLGLFDNIEDASGAYKKAVEDNHKEFANY